jgi:hypothetical protein
VIKILFLLVYLNTKIFINGEKENMVRKEENLKLIFIGFEPIFIGFESIFAILEELYLSS